MPVVAVLTGDLVKSTKAGPAAVDDSFACLAEASATIAAWSPGSNPRLTRFRGDGWQLLIEDAPLALRAALYILARLRSSRTALTSRIAIGIGTVSHTGSTDLSDAGGPAFEASGRALDSMPAYRRLAVSGERLSLLHPLIVELLEQQAARWTGPQAEAGAIALQPDTPTLEIIGAHLGITPQAVNYRLSGGGFQTIRRVLRGWEDAFEVWERTGSWTA